MKFLLIAVYLAHGDTSPRYETRGFDDRQSCQALAADYVKGKVMGQARAFCLQVKQQNT